MIRALQIKQPFSATGNPYEHPICGSFFKAMKNYHHVYETMDALCATPENYIFL